MRGFPAHLNTKQDYLSVHQLVLAGELPREELIAHYDALLNTRHEYVFNRLLAHGEEPDGPEPIYRVMEEENADGSTVRAQYKLVENPDARLFRLGFSVEEVGSLIEEVENLG